MATEIIDGEFIYEPTSNPFGEAGMHQPNYHIAVVRIKLDDLCWYKVHLYKLDESSDWHVGHHDIQYEGKGYSGAFCLPIVIAQDLVEKILNFKKFRLRFLFV